MLGKREPTVVVEEDPEALGPRVDAGGRARFVDHLRADEVSPIVVE